VKHDSEQAHDAQQRGDDLGGRVEVAWATAELVPPDCELTAAMRMHTPIVFEKVQMIFQA
jgi:hypothetical protein